jgi:hypothetical protein
MTTTQKFKVLGVEQGITITRPFNNEMFDHNDKVREIQTKAVLEALEKIKESEDDEMMHKAAKACSGYGYGVGYDLEDMFEDAARNVETQANNWMREDIWPGFLDLGLVQPIEMDYVGYKKL